MQKSKNKAAERFVSNLPKFAIGASGVMLFALLVCAGQKIQGLEQDLAFAKQDKQELKKIDDEIYNMLANDYAALAVKNDSLENVINAQTRQLKFATRPMSDAEMKQTIEYWQGRATAAEHKVNEQKAIINEATKSLSAGQMYINNAVQELTTPVY